MASWLYLSPDLDRAAAFRDDRLRETTERHRIPLDPGVLQPIGTGAEAAATRNGVEGVVLSMAQGWPGRHHLQLARRMLRARRRVWLYWPDEAAVESLDEERVRSYWRHWCAIQVFRRVKGLRPQVSLAGADELRAARARLAETIGRARPVPFDGRLVPPTSSNRLPGTGVYLRTDYWARIESGGSYGHTCYVAAELAATTGAFVAFMAHRYGLLDELGLRQVVIDPPAATAAEQDLIAATAHYERVLGPAFEALGPRYIYERLCLGNYAGARLSQDLQIPYVVEYNGSELSMRRSFQGDRYLHEDFFRDAETAAFRQATLITVVSAVVRDELTARGVDAARILVNPNGVDPTAYRPPDPAEKAAIREGLGWTSRDRVVGFIGTFGGWHGVDVLAEAMPGIAAAEPSAKFLLIGDGPHKALADKAVAEHHLESRVQATGRVPQKEGARLLRAADIYVSPHSSHMVDSRFFGSPTKLFEYMALGGGIVASDLEQIGQVLSPALRAPQLGGGVAVGAERAVLCRPGDVDDFTAAVVGLIRHPEIAGALGRNAREAAIAEFSWHQHVHRLWQALASGVPVASPPADTAEDVATPLVGSRADRIRTGDAYKDQVQNQWNNNPVGSQYVKEAAPHTLDWFLEVEAHRYGEYGPWMPEIMEFADHAGHDVLEIGGGMGTDLAQFAKHGARVTDVDLSAGHLALAQENFRLRALEGRFVHHDAERLPFDDASFDLVYSNGVIHHTPNTRGLVDEISRVLRPGGRCIIMVYAENSLHYWGVQVGLLGLRGGMLATSSMGDIMSRSVEMTANDARPLVKVYTKRRLRALFERFVDIRIVKRQLTAAELPAFARWIPLDLAGRLVGWNLVLKASKPK